jgi:hypothetical protein
VKIMKKVYFRPLFFIVLLLIGIESAYAAGEFEQTSEQLVAKLHTFFPDVRGTVVSVQDNTVFIDVGTEKKISVGAQLALLQEGVEIVHPKTKKVLGKYEKPVGAIQITEIMEQFSVAKILWMEPDTEIVQGSTVAGFPGKIKIAVLPVINLTEKTINVDSAYNLFVGTMKADERFMVFDEADIKAAALKAGLSPDAITQKPALPDINTVLHAHNFLQITLQPDADNILVQAILLSATGEEIGNAQELVREYADLQQPKTMSGGQQELSQQQTTQEKYWTSDILRTKAHKIAVGDLTGDGKNEMVVATRTDLEVFEHGLIGEKESFLPLTRIEGYNDALILSLGIGDINGNGCGEIVITTLRTVSAEVRVFEYTEGKFKEIWRTKGIAMRVIHSPVGKTYLVGQKTTSSISMDFLTGKISEYAWDGNDYSRQKTLHIPGRVNLFNFTLADINKDGSNEVLSYDQFDRISLFQGEQRRWRSRSIEPYKMSLLRKGEDEDRAQRLSGRPELTTFGPDNGIYLVVFENLRPFKFIEGLPLYKGSQFYVLRWNGETFVQEFKSDEFESYTVDYAVADVDNDGKQEVALAMVLKGDDFFRTPQSQIMIYELE